MAKRSGSKSSRSERKAGKQRAQRARQHGLPEPQTRAPLRARAATPEPGSSRRDPDRSSDAPPPPAHKQLIPTPIKVLGIAVVILIGVYVLSQKRDEALTETHATPEAASALGSAAPAPQAPSVTAAPSVVAAAPPEASAVAAPSVVEAAPAEPASRRPRGRLDRRGGQEGASPEGKRLVSLTKRHFTAEDAKAAEKISAVHSFRRS